MVQQIQIKQLKDDFLGNGGILLKRGTEHGEPVIYQKKKDLDWCVRLTFTSEVIRDKHFNYLTRNAKIKKFFKSDE